MRSFILFLLLSGTGLHAQTFWSDRYDYYQSGHRGTTAGIGIYQANFKQLNERIHELGSESDFGSFFTSIGAGCIIPFGGRYGESDGYAGMEWILRRKFDVNDTFSVQFEGMHFITATLLGKDIWHSDDFDCVLSLGADWGFTRYAENYASHIQSYTNAFLSPMFRTDVRYVHKHLIVGTRMLARYDVTNPEWKSKVRSEYSNVAGTFFTGLAAEFYIGYCPTRKPGSQFVPASDAPNQ